MLEAGCGVLRRHLRGDGPRETHACIAISPHTTHARAAGGRRARGFTRARAPAVGEHVAGARARVDCCCGCRRCVWRWNFASGVWRRVRARARVPLASGGARATVGCAGACSGAVDEHDAHRLNPVVGAAQRRAQNPENGHSLHITGVVGVGGWVSPSCGYTRFARATRANPIRSITTPADKRR